MRLLLTACLFLLLSLAAAKAEWKKLDVVGMEISANPTAGREFPIYASQDSKINTPEAIAGSIAARIYSLGGLIEPILNPAAPIAEERHVFLIYPMTNALDGTPAALVGEYYSTCINEKFGLSFFGVNSLSSTSLKADAVPHELFHAVQAMYPWHQDVRTRCARIPEWLIEGTADAASYFAIESTTHNKGIDRTGHMSFLGLRRYDLPLFRHPAWQTCTDGMCKGQDAWENPSPIGYLTSSFWRFLMERISGIRSPDYNAKALEVLGRYMHGKPPADQYSDEEWLDWMAAHTAEMLGPFHSVYAEFVTEFASWPGSKYQIDKQQWLKDGFKGCATATLTPDHRSEKIKFTSTEQAFGGLYPVAARCIQITLEGFNSGNIQLAGEAIMKTAEQADQLMLGLASEEVEGAAPINCYDLAKGKPRGELSCLHFGKVTQWDGKVIGKKLVRSWRFAKRKADGKKVTFTFVLSNVRPDTPSKTEQIDNLDVKFWVAGGTGKTGAGASLGVPEPTNMGAMPDLSIPQRDLLYGISGPNKLAVIWPMNMSAFEFEVNPPPPGEPAASSPSSRTYSFMPLEPVAYGQTGAIRGVVQRNMRENETQIAFNMLCPGMQDAPSATIIQSDEMGLRVRIKTPLCGSRDGTMRDCQQGGCPQLDEVDVDLMMGAGWRQFSENTQTDLITPGVRHDIDRYHQVVFGEPLRLPPLPDYDSLPPEGVPIPVAATSAPTTSPAQLECDCSCDALAELESGKTNPMSVFMPGFQKQMQCMMECLPELSACPK